MAPGRQTTLKARKPPLKILFAISQPILVIFLSKLLSQTALRFTFAHMHLERSSLCPKNSRGGNPRKTTQKPPSPSLDCFSLTSNFFLEVLTLCQYKSVQQKSKSGLLERARG